MTVENNTGKKLSTCCTREQADVPLLAGNCAAFSEGLFSPLESKIQCLC